jgi:soluble lytic murein transglycosylase-like protein
VRARASWVLVLALLLASCQTTDAPNRPALVASQESPSNERLPTANSAPQSDKMQTPADAHTHAGAASGRSDQTFSSAPPGSARSLGRYLTRIDRLLARNIPRWRARGAPMGSPLAHRVLSEALTQQKIYRLLAAHQALTRRIRAMVRPRIAHEIHATVGAQRDLDSLVAPVAKIPHYEFARPLPPDRLRKLYLEAQRRYGVPWTVLAAINFIESKFGRILGPSSSGALGPMQFLPATFAAYGRGDINDPHDSILAAGRYLHADGAPERLRAALFAYNRANPYVDAVLRYAHQMASNDWSFWAYYGYQVFVTTSKGSVRLTGPGTRHPD